jgi:hypothetical protein
MFQIAPPHGTVITKMSTGIKAAAKRALRGRVTTRIGHIAPPPSAGGATGYSRPFSFRI